MLNSLKSLNNLYHQNPEKIIFVEDGMSITVKEFAEQVMSYIEKHAIQQMNIGVFSNNGIQWAIAECGLSATRNTFIPIPRFFSDDQLVHIIKDSEVSLIYTDEANYKRISNLFPNTELFLKESKTFFKCPHEEYSKHKRIIYTSGTTGAPKGVIQTEKQINIVCDALVNHFNISCNDKYFSLLPSSTLLEQIASIHCTLIGESCTVFHPKISNEIFNLKSNFVDEIAKSKISLLCLTPALLDIFLKSYEKSSLFSYPFKAITVGGAKTPLSLLNKAKELKLPVVEGYGLSECCSVLSVNHPSTNKIGTVGKVLPGMNVKIIEGEIVVSSETLMNGYKNKEAFKDHSYHTGDLGEMDHEGYLTVIGRKDEVIALKNGRNINPSWIENLVSKNLNLTDVFAFNNIHNEFSLAVRIPEERSSLNLKSLVSEIVPEYARPERIYSIQPDFIMNNTLINSSGKIDKFKLQKIINTKLTERSDHEVL
jgi:long-chain acyl-CoA synthetase